MDFQIKNNVKKNKIKCSFTINSKDNFENVMNDFGKLLSIFLKQKPNTKKKLKEENLKEKKTNLLKDILKKTNSQNILPNPKKYEERDEVMTDLYSSIKGSMPDCNEFDEEDIYLSDGLWLRPDGTTYEK